MARIVHTALVQFKPDKGEYHANLARLTQVFDTIATLSPRPDVVTLPESACTGYFLEGGVRELAQTADAFAHDLNRHYNSSKAAGQPLDVVVGFYELHDNTLYNSAMYVTLGGDSPNIVHIHRKVFLPTYGVFDEERFVERGLEIKAFDTKWGRAAILVCEDAWHSIAATIAAVDGAQIIFIPSASPARGAWPTQEVDEHGAPLPPAPASVHRWERIARDRAEEHGVYVAVTQLVGNEGGKAFAGGSVIAGPHGEIRNRGPLWEEAIIPAALDLDDITRARADTPLLMDLRTMLPYIRRSLQRAAAPDDSSWRSAPSVAHQSELRDGSSVQDDT
jgi:NAD+ synthase (glutamine-hydrolysing)